MPRKLAGIPVHRRMIDWYRKEARKDLPWRKTRDPYRVWISETMLQQTQVATVIPYYRRFLRRFPTVQTLSRAKLTEVLDNWAGLGYYSRARNLHACAQAVVRNHGGRLPDEVEALMRLPGIGRCTAGAIASIAYNRPAPILDGNVQRVLSRYSGIRENPRSAAVAAKLWELAGRLVPREAPGDFNQALMDLGATLCTLRHPHCGSCPLTAGCSARRRGCQDLIPPPRPAPSRKKIFYSCALLRKNGSLLIARRPIETLLPGLWEFPGGERRSGESFPAALQGRLRERLGIKVREPAHFTTIKQTLSHRELEIRAFACPWDGNAFQPRWYTQAQWVPLERLKDIPFTAGMAKVAGRLLERKP